MRRILCIRLPPGSLKDFAALARLAEHCERYSPIVGWETVEGWEGPKSKVQGPKLGSDFGPWTLDLGLLLDVTGIGILFGGEDALARAVIADLEGLGYEARVSIAGTIGAAWAAAQLQIADCGLRNDEASGQVLSTKYLVLSTEPPAGCTVLSLSPSLPPSFSASPPPIRNPKSEIRNFPLASLRLPSETLALLAQLGIERLDQLLALPRASLRARFGERLLLRIDQFTGAAQETIVAYRSPPKFAAEKVLEYPAERRDIIEQIVQELIHRIASSLAERREGVVQLACRLDCAPGQPVTIEVGLFRPSASPQHLWELMRMQLEQLRLPGAVGRFTLQAKLTAPLENRQGQLFTGNQDEATRQFGLLIDRLSSRLGPDAVLRPRLIADPLPERAVGWESGVGSQESGVRGKTRSAKRGRRNDGQVPSTEYPVLSTKNRYRPPTLDSRPPTHRPLTLGLPHALQVTSIFPDGPPLMFHFQGRQHEVAHYTGPERIETGWWRSVPDSGLRSANVRRDYYRVETEDGLRFWLFRDLKTGQWHLHGEFS
jgi:protein ImuB